MKWLSNTYEFITGGDVRDIQEGVSSFEVVCFMDE